MADSPGEITRLLVELGRGNRHAESELVPLIYKQLRNIAAHHMRFEQPGHIMQPTALVHEAYFRLFRNQRADWKGRAQFFAVASGVMRRILVDEARKRSAGKRAAPAAGAEAAFSGSPRPEDLIAVDEALTRLAAWDERQSRVVEMLFFGGLTEEEVAEVLEVSARTVKRDWQSARAWLHTQLGEQSP